MLKNKFQTLCQNFTSDQKLIGSLWQEIKQRHAEPTRHYHTLKHLEHIYSVLPKLDYVTEFAIFYHDIVYDASRNDNEEQSALLCEKQLKLLGVNSELIADIFQLILETKTHEPSSQRNALFLDTDLAILGSSVEVYNEYIQNVRKEYAIYSDDVYKKGRQKVLEHFLEKERIYISDTFYELYEEQARNNITIEYNSLIQYTKEESMCDFNNLSEEEKLRYHELLMTCANNYGGLNFFLQLLEAIRDTTPHPLASSYQDFLFDLGDIRWGKTIFNDKIELIKSTRVARSSEKSFLPNEGDKKYKKVLNLIRTLDPIVFSVRPKLRDEGEGFDFKAFEKVDEQTVTLNPIFEALFFCSIDTVKKILTYK